MSETSPLLSPTESIFIHNEVNNTPPTQAVLTVILLNYLHA